MKNIILKDINDFQRLKESLDNIINTKISKMKLDECTESFDALSFACLDGIFKDTVDKLYETKEGKKLIKKYVKTIKESNDLKQVYTIYNIVNTPNNINDGFLFLKEAITIVNNIDQEKYKNSLSGISNILKECVKLLKLDTKDIKSIKDKYNNSVNESLDRVLFEKMNTKNIVEHVNDLSKVTKFIDENKKSNANIVTESKSISDLINEFNNLFTNNIESWEASAIKEISFAELSGNSKKNIFESYKTECLKIVEENLNEKDIEYAGRFQVMKEKLEKKEFNADTAVDDILMLSELKHVLNS